MPLSCSCDFDGWEPEPGDWELDHNKHIDFEPFKRWISKRCISCNDLISMGDFCLEFTRLRHPYSEIEARCNGVDWDSFEEPVIKIPPVYQCEKCGEIYLNLDSVGFKCIWPGENMPEMLKEFQNTYKPLRLSNSEN